MQKFDHDTFDATFKPNFLKVTREFTRPRNIYVGDYKGELIAVKYGAPREEWKMHKFLFNYPHPNIISTKGRMVYKNESKDDDFRTIIMEGVEHGLTASYTTFLREFGDASLKSILVAIRGLADGLRHLHSLNIIHHDLSSSNVLVTKKIIPETEYQIVLKICDFELSEIVFPGGVCSLPNASSGTHGFIAPEQYSLEAKITDKIDIFAFGNVVDSMMCGRFGFDEYFEKTPMLMALTTMCKSSNPNERPSANEVVYIMDHIIGKLG